jgi:hypothetical protein
MASGASASSLTARFLLPDQLERGRPNALSCPVWQDAALVAPSSGTVTIYDGGGAVLVSAAAVTVTGSIATYSYTPAATIPYGEGWRVEWSLVIAGVTHVFRNDGALVRVVLHSPITDADLFRRVSALDPAGAAPISSVADYQDFLDEAHAVIQLRLITNGNRPNLILSPSALREAYITLALALIFGDFETRLSETYAERASEYRRQYERAWGELRFTYASTDEAEGGSSLRRRSASPTVWLTSRGR